MSAARHKAPEPLAAESAPWAARVRRGPWFRGLPPDLQDALLAQARVRRCADRQRLFTRGDAPDGLYCVAEGAVRASGVSADGREALLALIESPHWFGEISLLDGLPRTHDASAQGACVLLHVPLPGLLALLEAEPRHWRAIGLLAAGKLRAAFGALEESALLPAERRIAARLLAMSEGYGEAAGETRRVLKVSQDQLALMLSLSRQTVNQALRGFAQAGVVKPGRGGVEIVDPQRLGVIAGRLG